MPKPYPPLRMPPGDDELTIDLLRALRERYGTGWIRIREVIDTATAQQRDRFAGSDTLIGQRTKMALHLCKVLERGLMDGLLLEVATIQNAQQHRCYRVLTAADRASGGASRDSEHPTLYAQKYREVGPKLKQGSKLTRAIDQLNDALLAQSVQVSTLTEAIAKLTASVDLLRGEPLT
jgi:hypothetical protein